MKKISLFVTGLFALVIYSTAQNTSPYWSLAGNSNATNSSKLGSTNNISLRFYTNNIQRMIINSAAGYVGIGTPSPVNILTVKSGGGTPAASWLNGLSSPVFVGFGETVSSEFLLAGASNIAVNRAVFQGRRSRGTLAAPTAVANNDYITSLLASAYDGATFQNPALVSFFVDGTPSAGHVPARISFVTGTNSNDRVERLKVGSTGNFNFNNGQVYLKQSNGYLGIGTTAPSYKLHVEASGSAVYGNSINFFGVYGNGPRAGVYGSGTDYGVWGYSDNTGVFGDGSSYGVYGNGGIYGVYGNSVNGNGLRGASGSGTGVYGKGGPIGVYGVGTNDGGVFYGGPTGIAASGSTYAGYFSGNVYASGVYSGSDRNLKKNIKEFNRAIDIINKLKPRQYDFRHDGNYEKMNLPTGNHYGLIAQDVEEILPNLVKDSKFETNFAKEPFVANPDPSKPAPLENKTETKSEPINFKALNYTELIPIIVKGMQEQQILIEKQQEQINELKTLVQKLSKDGSNDATGLSTAFLKQNTPNPANNNTVISYYIPDNAGYAQIKITDMKGRVIKSFNAVKGEGQINMRSGELPAGSYNYTLYINNKTIDTKQMVLLK